MVFGPVTNPENERLFDLNSRELGLLLPLLFLMLFMGVYPRVFLDRSQASVETVRLRVSPSRRLVHDFGGDRVSTDPRSHYERMNSFLAQSVMPIINWALIAPEVIVCLAAVLVRCSRCICAPDAALDHGWYFTGWHRCGAIATIWLWATGIGGASADAFNGMIVLDELRLGFTLIFLLVSGLTVLLSTVWVGGENLPAGEFHSLLLFATSA